MKTEKATKTDEEAKNKQNKTVLAQSDKIIKKIANTKQERHVKEPTEPVFKNILEDYTYSYAKSIGKTAVEILKLNKNEFQ